MPRQGVGPLSPVLQLIKGRNSSPALMISGLVLPPASGIDGGAGHLSPTRATTWQMSNGGSSPMLSQHWGWFTHTSAHRVSSTVLHSMPGFLKTYLHRQLNSGPHACKASALFSDLYFHPGVLIETDSTSRQISRVKVRIGKH